MSLVISPLNQCRPWHKGRVPYAFDALSFGGKRNASLKGTIDSAITSWNDLGLPVRFVPHSAEPNFLLFTANPVPTNIIPDVSGSSASDYTGMHGAMQLMWVSAPPNVTPQRLLASITHEMGHVVGLFHEQNRNDRNHHVKIVWQNIDPLAYNNFAQEPPLTATDVGPYDFESLMHYPVKAYSRNGGTTINILDPGINGDDVGTAFVLSEGDVDGIRYLYDNRMFATIFPPALMAFQYPEIFDPPSVRIPVPQITVTPPSIHVEPPSIKIGRHTYGVPAFDLQPPSVTVSPPDIVVDPPPLPSYVPPVMVTPPPMRVRRNNPPRNVSITPPSFTVDPPPVTLDPPEMTVNPPSVHVTFPSITVKPGSFKAGLVTVTPDAITVNVPAIDVTPPSLHYDPPPVTLDPPAVTVNPPHLP